MFNWISSRKTENSQCQNERYARIQLCKFNLRKVQQHIQHRQNYGAQNKVLGKKKTKAHLIHLMESENTKNNESTDRTNIHI